MIDERLIKGATEIANERIRREFPLLKQHLTESMVKYACEALFDLCLALGKEKKK